MNHSNTYLELFLLCLGIITKLVKRSIIIAVNKSFLSSKGKITKISLEIILITVTYSFTCLVTFTLFQSIYGLFADRIIASNSIFQMKSHLPQRVCS